MIAAPVVVETSVCAGRRRLLYFNVFVAIRAVVRKNPRAGSDGADPERAAFKLTQLVVLALFLVPAPVAAIRFRPEPVQFNDEYAAWELAPPPFPTTSGHVFSAKGATFILSLGQHPRNSCKAKPPALKARFICAR